MDPNAGAAGRAGHGKYFITQKTNSLTNISLTGRQIQKA